MYENKKNIIYCKRPILTYVSRNNNRVLFASKGTSLRSR